MGLLTKKKEKKLSDQYPMISQLMAAAGIETLQSKGDGSLILDQASLELLESHITEVEAEEQATAATIEAAQKSTDTLKALESAISTACSENEVEEGATAEESVGNLSAHIAMLGDQTGEKPTAPVKKEEKQQDAKEKTDEFATSVDAEVEEVNDDNQPL